MLITYSDLQLSQPSWCTYYIASDTESWQ